MGDAQAQSDERGHQARDQEDAFFPGGRHQLGHHANAEGCHPDDCRGQMLADDQSQDERRNACDETAMTIGEPPNLSPANLANQRSGNLVQLQL